MSVRHIAGNIQAKRCTGDEGNSHAADIWQKVYGMLRERLGETAFQRWLAPLPVDLAPTPGVGVRLNVPTRFMRDWITQHYADQMQTLWQQAGGQGGIEYIVTGALRADTHRHESRPPHATPDSIISSSATAAMPASRPDQTPVNPGASFTDDFAAALDPRFTFDNFIVGKTNELAFAAARRVAETATPSFNPLFLYGGCGLGKTHLMHAIAWHIRKNAPQRRVIYMSAEKFMYQFVRALRFKDTVAFKEQFRSVDVLMIDDVQFISGREHTQEEFFHTFNALVDQNRQVIVSADKSPQDLDKIEERLRSRLGWGLVADIHPTSYELRLSILQSKAAQAGCVIPGKVLEFLAYKIASNVRELEGALNRIVAHAQLVGREITLEMTQEVLADLLRASDRRITIDEIQKRVAEHYNIRLVDMHSARRARIVARPRQVAMYLAKQLTPRSLPEIGRKFGGRDHTTVIHAVRKVEELTSQDQGFRDDVELLRRLLQGHHS
ncbi:MAG: chromosomal replication initiator protein DnaA [Alphaproteobacteria bacterium]